MKRLFGAASKTKNKGINNQSYADETTPPGTPGTPIHAAHAVYQQQLSNFRPPPSGLQPLRPGSMVDPDQSSAEDLSYEPHPSIHASRTSSFASLQSTVVPGSLPPGASPPNPNNPSSPSLPPPSSTLRKKQPQRDNSGGSISAPIPSVTGILKALDPTIAPTVQAYPSHHHSSSDLHHPPSGRETPISYMQVHSDDAAIHKDKSKWSLFGRNNSHVDDVKDKDRRKDEKAVLSTKELEARKIEKQRREEREHHWQFVDRDDKKEREPYRADDRMVDRDRELAELTRMIGLKSPSSEYYCYSRSGRVLDCYCIGRLGSCSRSM